MRPQVAYITADPGADPDLVAAMPALDHAGLDVHPVPWDGGFPWSDADLVLVASPHDVGRRRPQFLRWAREVEDHTKLANAALTLVRNTDLVPDAPKTWEDLEKVALEWGRLVNGKSPTAQRMLKFSFNLIDDGLVGQQVFAGEATRLAYGTDEAAEGRDSFLEKRDPDWGPYPWHY